MFDATLALSRVPLTRANLRGLLLRLPLMTLKTVLAIYWQALRLLAKMLPAGTAKPMIAALMAEKGEFDVSEESVSMDVAGRLIIRAQSEGLLSSDGMKEQATAKS